MLTFTITDPDMAKTQTAQRRGMKARAFSKTKDDLPPVRTRGDVVLLRRWKVGSPFLIFYCNWLQGSQHSSSHLRVLVRGSHSYQTAAPLLESDQTLSSCARSSPQLNCLVGYSR